MLPSNQKREKKIHTFWIDTQYYNCVFTTIIAEYENEVKSGENKIRWHKMKGKAW